MSLATAEDASQLVHSQKTRIVMHATPKDGADSGRAGLSREGCAMGAEHGRLHLSPQRPLA